MLRCVVWCVVVVFLLCCVLFVCVDSFAFFYYCLCGCYAVAKKPCVLNGTSIVLCCIAVAVVVFCACFVFVLGGCLAVSKNECSRNQTH